MQENKEIFCWFCKRSRNEVSKLIAGPKMIFICNRCIDNFSEALAYQLPESDKQKSQKLKNYLKSENILSYIKKHFEVENIKEDIWFVNKKRNSSTNFSRNQY